MLYAMANYNRVDGKLKSILWSGLIIVFVGNNQVAIESGQPEL